MNKREKVLIWLCLLLFVALAGAMATAWRHLGGDEGDPETFDALRRMTLP